MHVNVVAIKMLRECQVHFVPFKFFELIMKNNLVYLIAWKNDEIDNKTSDFSIYQDSIMIHSELYTPLI